MNLASSVAESYMYIDMLNREYSGGTNVPEKIHAAGYPVEKIVPSIGKNTESNKESNTEIDRPEKMVSGGGPFSDKVVPVGLFIINSREESNAEYENYFHPGVHRDVISESLYDKLMSSVVRPNPKSRSTPKKHSPQNNHRSRRIQNKK
jgi:hypothetical protein